MDLIILSIQQVYLAEFLLAAIEIPYGKALQTMYRSIQQRSMTGFLDLQIANAACQKSRSNRSPASTHSLCYKTEDSD